MIMKSLICIEGIDGAGKETQSRMLGKRLTDLGVKSVVYSYPDYKTRYGKIVREFLDKKIEMGAEELFFLHMLDKLKDKEQILHDLEEKVVILDRYIYSAIAYQTAGGFDYEKAKMIVKASGLPKPSVVLYLDVSVETAMKRKKKQKNGALDRFESLSGYLNSVKGVYDRLFSEHFDSHKWIRIDAEKDIATTHEELCMEASRLI